MPIGTPSSPPARGRTGPCEVVSVDAQEDESHGVYFPSAPAVLIDVDGDTPLPSGGHNNHAGGNSGGFAINPYCVTPLHPHHDGSGTNNNITIDNNNNNSNSNYNNTDPLDCGYASAQVVGTEISPFSQQLSVAMATHVEAIPLDPWSKAPTMSSAGTNDANGGPDGGLVLSTGPNYGGGVVAPLPPPSDGAVIVVEPASPIDNFYDSRLGQAMLEDPWQKKIRRRRRRRSRMIVGGMTGFVVGTFTLGPLGGLAGAAAGAVASRTASKIGERRKDKRVERERRRLLEGPEETGTALGATAPPEAYAIADGSSRWERRYGRRRNRAGR